MRSNATLLTTGALIGVVLGATVIASVVRAQQPQQPGAAPGGQGGGGGRFGGGGFGGQGGGGRMPFATGTVSAVDATAGTITVTPQQGGNPQIIQVPQGTTINTQKTVTIDALKAGDQIQVQGKPTGITVSTLTAGQRPNMFPGRGPAPGAGQPGAAAAPGAQPGMAVTQASGLFSKDPPTLWVDKDTPIPLKMAADAKVTKFETIGVDGVKVGDQVMATGQANNDGTFAATSVNINMNTGGAFGRGGFGGAGFGPGGGGPGGGGFGGGGGRGRRNRGGGGGAAPGAPAAQ